MVRNKKYLKKNTYIILLFNGLVIRPFGQVLRFSSHKYFRKET